MSSPVHQQGDEAGQQEAAQRVAGEAEAVREAAAGARELFVDLEDAGDGADAAAGAQAEAEAGVEERGAGPGSHHHARHDQPAAQDGGGSVAQPPLQPDNMGPDNCMKSLSKPSLYNIDYISHFSWVFI